ncbi:MAG: cob(I)yrinic acid a,c-diamide adenosyltransferase [Parcubacteria group bacterium]|nr:cob(I)yrinic acid a,c-diamide adenosyltransferase [Parcubacteria group bacterium]
MIIIYTGNGKGKTTAAIGQAVRALGESKKVIIIQFIKGPWISGEDVFAKKLKIVKGGKGFVGIMGDRLPRSVHKKAAKDTLKLAEKTILSKKYDLVILDEVNVAVGLKLISENEVLKMLKKTPQGIDVILTGRGAPKKFIDLAEIATEMKEIKYKFRPSKQGLEY